MKTLIEIEEEIEKTSQKSDGYIPDISTQDLIQCYKVLKIKLEKLEKN